MESVGIPSLCMAIGRMEFVSTRGGAVHDAGSLEGCLEFDFAQKEGASDSGAMGHEVRDSGGNVMYLGWRVRELDK
eukprot:4218144-Karenia_brevis.AAC.1